ncbi:hypothetical protein J1N35_017694 [Gossypium stocksii]|uniref:Uncharacterized protein n=1 Tax=Gossypium stocksii TaxID=47602 RepID=A0A9D3VNS0_9ROSI|nr:hypothetical protein J1N35_017694 [Gossypium stocksii]
MLLIKFTWFNCCERQRQQQEAGGMLIRSILSSNETSQNQSLATVQAQQKTEFGQCQRPTNSQLGLNGRVSNDIAALEYKNDI